MTAVDDRTLTQLAVLAALLAGSAFFSASEAAFFSLNLLKVRHLKAKGGRRGGMVASLLERPKQLITTIIMGNELINIAASSLVGGWFISRFGPEGQWYAVALMTVVILIFAEIIPKTMAVTHAVGFALGAAPLLNPVARLAAGPARVVQWIAGGISRALGAERDADLITEDEFKGLVREGTRSGVLDPDEADIITGILELGDTSVAELMVPRTEMAALPEETPLAQVLEEFRERPRSSLALYRGDPDQVTGILYAKDLLLARAGSRLDPAAAASSLAKPPVVVPESMRADDLLIELRNRRVHVAVVVDEYGGTAGMVTLQALIGRVFEDVTRGERPGDGLWESPAEGVWDLSGRLPVEEMNRLLGTSLDGEGYTTVGGMLFHLFGRLPRKGESVRAGGLAFQVTAVAERRIASVRVERPAGGTLP